PCRAGRRGAATSDRECTTGRDRRQPAPGRALVLAGRDRPDVAASCSRRRTRGGPLRRPPARCARGRPLATEPGSRSHAMSRSLSLLAAALFVLPVSAHDGEDHGAPVAATAPAAGVGPRAAAATELFELVAVVSGDHLTLYLDRFASNEPVSGAKVD